MEMQRILADPSWIATAQEKWKNVVRQTFSQAKLESMHKSVLRDVLQEGGKFFGDGSIGEKGKTYIITFFFFHTADNTVVAFAALPYLVPDARYKADHNKVLFFTEVCMGTHAYVVHCMLAYKLHYCMHLCTHTHVNPIKAMLVN